jgi:O-antigen/teichoic acid export membrane protein
MLKKFLCYGGFSLASTLFGILSLPVLTSFLLPSEYGILGISLTILSLLVPLNTLSNEHNVQAIKTRATLGEYSHYWDVLCSFSFLIFVGCLFVFSPLVYAFDFPIVLVLIPLLSLVRALRLLKQAELAVSDRDFLYGLSSLLIAVFAFFVTLFIFYFYSASAALRIVGLLFSEILVFVYIIKIRFTFIVDTKTIKKLIIFGFPLIISILPAWLVNESSRFFLLHYGSLEVVGLFTLSFQISVIYLQFNTVLANTYVKKILKDIGASFKLPFILKITFIQAACALIFVMGINYLGAYILPDSF